MKLELVFSDHSRITLETHGVIAHDAVLELLPVEDGETVELPHFLAKEPQCHGDVDRKNKRPRIA